MTGDEKWIFYNNSKKKKYYAKPGQLLPSTSTSTSWSNIHGSKIMIYIWWDQKGLVYYVLLKPDDSITGDRYRLQLIRLNRALPEYEQRHDKVILLHDNARPHVAKVVKKYLETLKWMFYRTRHILRTLLLLITDCSEGCSKSSVHHFFRRNRKLAPKLDRLQRRVIFSRWNSKIVWEMGKSNRQRWTIL